jgi:hypothetical protein
MIHLMFSLFFSSILFLNILFLSIISLFPSNAKLARYPLLLLLLFYFTCYPRLLNTTPSRVMFPCYVSSLCRVIGNVDTMSDFSHITPTLFGLMLDYAIVTR